MPNTFRFAPPEDALHVWMHDGRIYLRGYAESEGESRDWCIGQFVLTNEEGICAPRLQLLLYTDLPSGYVDTVDIPRPRGEGDYTDTIRVEYRD